MIASGGQMQAVGKRFSYRPMVLTATVVNIDVTRMARARSGSFEPEVDGDESDVIRMSIDFPVVGPVVEKPEKEPWMVGATVKEEEFTRAVCLGSSITCEKVTREDL